MRFSVIRPSPPRPPHPNPRQAPVSSRLALGSKSNKLGTRLPLPLRRHSTRENTTPRQGPQLSGSAAWQGPCYAPLNRDSGPWRRRKASCSKPDKLGTSITTRQTTRKNRPIQEGPQLSSHAAPSTPSQGAGNGEQTAEPISWGPGCGRGVYAGSTRPFHRVPSLEEVQPRQPWAMAGGAWVLGRLGRGGCITLGA